MGACGHSRVREFILGGASLSMIYKPTSTHFYHLWSWEATRADTQTLDKTEFPRFVEGIDADQGLHSHAALAI